MSIRIFNNPASINAQRLLADNTIALQKSVEKISSGQRINGASDDSAGLAISEGLRADIRALTQAIRNGNDGISLLNITEGSLSEQSSILIRLRELASQAATGTVGSTERQTIQLEFNALRSELDRITNSTEFNGNKLLDGALGSTVSSSNHIIVQIGINATANDRINLNNDINLSSITASSLQINSSIVAVSTYDVALTALDHLSTALKSVNDARGKIGAVNNRLVRSINNLSVAKENYQAADSQIRDADIAQEIADLTRNQILVTASTAMVGQANLLPQSILQLLG